MIYWFAEVKKGISDWWKRRRDRFNDDPATDDDDASWRGGGIVYDGEKFFDVDLEKERPPDMPSERDGVDSNEKDK